MKMKMIPLYNNNNNINKDNAFLSLIWRLRRRQKADVSSRSYTYGLPVGPPDPGRLRRGEVVNVPPEVVKGGHGGGRQLWNSSENNLRQETKSIFAFFRIPVREVPGSGTEGSRIWRYFYVYLL